LIRFVHRIVCVCMCVCIQSRMYVLLFRCGQCTVFVTTD
jgi:hypothetical protein